MLFHNLVVLPLTSRSADVYVEKHISRNDDFKEDDKKKLHSKAPIADVIYIILILPMP